MQPTNAGFARGPAGRSGVWGRCRGGLRARAASPPTVVRVTSGTPGHEVRLRGVVLVLGQPMQVVVQTTSYEGRSEDRLVFAAFEPAELEAMLRLELRSDLPEPAVITAPRVMVGRRIGGVATDFVQGYRGHRAGRQPNPRMQPTGRGQSRAPPGRLVP
jgi:hypothetical protein